ncbi:MAG: M15 family metallopeptidase [Bacteroidales bacterium]
MKKRLYYSLIIILSFSVLSCSPPKNNTQTNPQMLSNTIVISPMEKELQDMGLVNIQDIDSTIDVQIVYATCHNFMGKKLYKDLDKAYLLPEVAQKLKKAHQILRKMRPDVHFVVYDAARPVQIQQAMWDMVKGTYMDGYVANPAHARGMHNYGVAVDLTLVDCTGHPLPMGSTYDYFGKEAHSNHEAELLKNHRITKVELENRLLLRKVMVQAGFDTITSEWWHFNGFDSSTVPDKYPLIK